MSRNNKHKAGGLVWAQLLVLGVTLVCVGGFTFLMLRTGSDSGVRLWILNHAPDQAIIINPYSGGGVVEKRFQVADGLRDIAFSWDGKKAFIGNVVDVSNRLQVFDTTTYLKEETMELDGVPQGIGVFPDNHTLAVILGSKTDFMAGGFDVFDLNEQSKADPKKKKRLYRERGLSLSHQIAIGNDGDRIYCIDAKSDLLAVFSLKRKAQIKAIPLNGAPEEMLYPRVGDYYYISVLQHKTIYQLDKETDEIVNAFIYELPDPDDLWGGGKLRKIAVNSNGHYLFGTNYEMKTVAIWEIGNPEFQIPWQAIPVETARQSSYISQVPYYLPMTRFKLAGGYKPGDNYIPGGQHIEVSPNDEHLFVMDEYGALYIYNLKGINGVMQAKDLSVPEPLDIISEFSNQVTEIRDMKVTMPVVRSSSPGGGDG